MSPKKLPDFADILLSLEKEENIIGIRHHSPACAYMVKCWLEQQKPDLILLELPTVFKDWLKLLSPENITAPIAIAGHEENQLFSFYPFADFSPELVAIRWAQKNNIPLEPCDAIFEYQDAPKGNNNEKVLETLLEKFRSNHFESLWDQVVESGDFTPEKIRKSALRLGLSLRVDSYIDGSISQENFARETFMRDQLAKYKKSYKKINIIVGSFHATALLKKPMLWEEVRTKKPRTNVATSLIPYSFKLLDSRSGYPAGIRDPYWRQKLWERFNKNESLEQVVVQTTTEICKNIREQGHNASTADAIEILRMTKDLSTIRGLPSIGRREYLEVLETCLTHGEVYGRGRVVAKALQQVLVGDKTGKLGKNIPRSGLYNNVLQQMEKCKLPSIDSLKKQAKVFKLNPFRSERDKNRHIFFERLQFIGIDLAKAIPVQKISVADPLSSQWEVSWKPIVEAQIDIFSIYGVHLQQVCVGLINKQEKEKIDVYIHLFEQSCRCVLEKVAVQLLKEIENSLHQCGSILQVMSALKTLDKARNNLIPGFAKEILGDDSRYQQISEKFYNIAIGFVAGLKGSKRQEDAQGILALIQYQIRSTYQSIYFKKLLVDFSRDGSYLMRGLCHVALILMEEQKMSSFHSHLVSLFANSHFVESGRSFAQFLQGCVTLASELFYLSNEWLEPLYNKIDDYSDRDFLQRLPFLRSGFATLSATAKTQIMELLSQRCGGSISWHSLRENPQTLLLWANGDLHAKELLHQNGFGEIKTKLNPEISKQPHSKQNNKHKISLHNRYALIFGQKLNDYSGLSGLAANCLEGMYGGSDNGGSPTEKGFPTVREWKEALVNIFEKEIYEEILAEGATNGRIAALSEIDPSHVRPSVDLLERILCLKGSISQKNISHFRQLANRIIEQLVQQLAHKIQPAISGLTVPRPTYRNTGKVHLKKTIDKNLAKSRKDKGKLVIFPEKIVFKTKMNKSFDWRIILVVDVSGSMEKSVIHSAIMASILARLPAVTINFIAFNTEIIDFSHLTQDPLELLLEVSIGGGTLIAKGLRYARSLMQKPAKTIVLTISDFEEGGSLGHLLYEVDLIKNSGCQLLGLASLDGDGLPRYNTAVAKELVAAGMPIAALTPLELARWIAQKIKG